jgi:phosphatidylserine/phosphatidylglycerophosphate/cardiolipin synthase-like enzyme
MDHGPWHDTGVRVQGPILRDFENEFRRRWQLATRQTLPPNQFPNTPVGTSRVESKFHSEQTVSNPIKDWYLASISAAQDFVYIENQYFDDQDITRALYTRFLSAETSGNELPMAIVLPWYEAIAALPPWHPIRTWTTYLVTELRVRTAKRLRVRGAPTVYIRPRGGWSAVRVATDPTTAELTIAAALNSGNSAVAAALLATIRPHFEFLVGNRWVKWKNIRQISGGIDVFRMMAHAGTWPAKPVYVHSKLAIVDSAYTVGSSNINQQSFITDSESNVVVDGQREVNELIGILWTDFIANPPPLQSNPGAWLQTFRRESALNESNRKRAQRGRPSGPPAGMLIPWLPLEY